MFWVKGVLLYFVLVNLWTGLLKLIQIALEKIKSYILDKSREKQIQYIKNSNRKKLVKSIKCEMFLEDKLNILIPYFPFQSKMDYSDEELMYEIRKDYKILFFYLKKLLPFKISSIIIIYLIIEYYFKFDISKYLQNVELGELSTIFNNITLLPSLIVVVIIIVSIFFISRNGVFKKAKSKVKVEEVENKIKFHKDNRILLNSLLFDGYKNIEHILLKRNSLIKQVDEKDDITSLQFDWLNNIEDINELNMYIENTERRNRDLFPFAFGIYHISFWKLFNLYSEKNRVNKLKAIFLTKEHMENVIKQKWISPENFEKMLNDKILTSVKTIIYIEKYLVIINRKLNKQHYIYSFLAFITNKDK
ncbi:hypothetical protein HF078_05565 [Bacillus sp. RO2]|uniref:hypothetical protein n=1 Tax=Bacillus sp. RO2 TaxID=2723913 RepID=UPI00145FBDFB|nr:hypothetical protein [Bacillus sp. RO2]NMH72536.1 hypothetical protein [Bacillus sp. RO2]